MRKIFLPVMLAIGVLFAAVGAHAAGGGEPLLRQSWPWDGLFGRYDKAALHRGFQVYHEVCSACHGLSRVAYRNLGDIGFTEEQIKQIAAEKDVTDGPNDEGEMFTRPALPSDRFVSPYPNDEAARAAQNGALPPDMSLIVKARPRGADYIYNLLLGYVDDDKVPAYLLEHPQAADFMRNPDLHFNRFFTNGNLQIAMAPPLVLASSLVYGDGTEVTDQQVAHDVVSFLNWASDPHLDWRKSLGIKVMLFMAVLVVLLYALKRVIWSRLEDH